MTNETAPIKPLDALCDASMRLDDIYGVFAKRHGETYLSMWAIYELGTHPEGLTQKQLASALYSPKQTVSSLIASLERRGLVRTVSSENDKRSKNHFLTEQGERLFREVDSEQEEYEIACLQELGSERMARMIADIDAVLTCIERKLANEGKEQG